MTPQFHKQISKEQVFKESRRRRTTITRLAIILGIIVAAVVTLKNFGIASNTLTMILLVVSFATGALVNAKVWRCPSCKGHLGKLYLGLKYPKHCPNCGIKLIDD
jgi:hypothetical protein